jgi:pantoate--beta-alanine ligase
VTRLAHSRAELALGRNELAGTVGLVPTMGALHAGHLANIDLAKASCDSVVVSIFVNPMQFNQAADLERYPRPIEADLELCRQHGADLVWVPDVATVYAAGPAQVWVTAGELANQLEGPHRPGHFDGVLTVVLKLFHAARPDRAFFGEKDYQQLTLIRRMVADLDLDVQIEGTPTVRDPDGLALSSRNVFLSGEQRQQALALSTALRSGQAAAEGAPPDGGAAVLAAAHAVLKDARGVDVEYLELRAADLGKLTGPGPARLLVAASIGSIRLIDNIALELP